MSNVYFEKYCTLINAVTQSCLTYSSITIYEAESGMIRDSDRCHIEKFWYRVSWQAGKNEIGVLS